MSKKGKNPEMSSMITIDTPVYYDLSEIRAKLAVLDSEKNNYGCDSERGTFYGKFARFLVRLDGKLNDPRYAFMFRLKNYVQSSAIKRFAIEDTGCRRQCASDNSGYEWRTVRYC